MELNDIIDEVISKFNNDTKSFNDSIEIISFKENNKNYHFTICTKTMEILDDNFTIDIRRKIYNILNRKLLSFNQEKYISEYGFLYEYLEKTDRLNYIVEKRECPDFRIFNENEEEYIEVTQDITRQEAMIIKCLNSYYYGNIAYHEDYKKYVNIKRVSDGILVSPKFKTNKKRRSENLFFSIKRKINKYTKYINELPEIVDATKTILVKMKSPYAISDKQKDIIQKRVNIMLQNTIVERVAILTNDNDLLIIERN